MLKYLLGEYMDIDMERVLDIIGGNPRFTDPSADETGYYIFANGNIIRAEHVSLYYEKLAYAAENADSLIAEGFQKEFFRFYGVNSEKAVSPESMCKRLIFDSFILVPEIRTIECCVSNPYFMSGHFIEYVWNHDWILQSVWIN